MRKIIKKNKAFTLIELLGVIVLLGIIGLITVPIINNVLKSSKENLYENQVNLLEDAARKWGVGNTSLLPDISGKTSKIEITTLIDSGYLLDKDVVDPRSGQKMNGCIIVDYNEDKNQYRYRYSETCDESEPSLKAPVITVLGKTINQTITMESTDKYNVPVGTAVDYEGKEVPVRVSGSITPDIPGTYKITYTATDSNGTSSKLILTIGVIDTEKPTISYTMYPSSPNGENGWYQMAITIQLSGSDTGSGISGYQYAINTGTGYSAWTNQASSTITLGTEGSTLQFKVRSKDAGGNYSDVLESPVIKLDITKPMVNSVTSNTTGWTSGPVIITVNGSDNLSGISEYSFDEGLTWQKENTKQFVSNQTVNVLVKDQAGNISSSKAIIINNIETTKPSIEYATIGAPFNSNGWANSNFNINVIPHVGSSGLKSYSYCVTTGSSCTPNIALNGTSQAVTISTESSTNKICTEAIDQTNASSGIVCSNVYKLDKTAPNFSNLTVNKTASSYNNLDTTLGIAASDANTIQMNISNSSYGTGAWENYVSSKGWNVGGALNGAYRTIYVQVRDLAGNVSSKAVGYTPYNECSVTTDTNFGGWGSCSVTCGGGIQYATGQKIDNYTGRNCGSATKSQSCNTGSCSIPPGQIITISGGENMNGRYYFRGSNPNNWVRFNDELWRIIYIENGAIKLLKNDILTSMEGYLNSGKNPILPYLNSTYLNSLNAAAQSKMLNATWYPGGISKSTVTPAAAKADELASPWTGYVGLVYPSDYGYTSKDSSCQTSLFGNAACNNENWLSNRGGYWTMSYQKCEAPPGSYCSISPAVIITSSINFSQSYGGAAYVIPAIFLKPEVTFAGGGTGTQANPYVVQ